MWAAMSCTAAPRMEEIMENQSLIHREANCLSRFDRLPVKSEMLKIIAVLAAVSVVEAFDLGLIGQTVLVLKQIWNLGPAETGLLATCSTIGVVLGTFSCGFLSDRYGRKRVLFWAVFIFTVFTFMGPLMENFYWVVVMRFLSGLWFGRRLPHPVPVHFRAGGGQAARRHLCLLQFHPRALLCAAVFLRRLGRGHLPAGSGLEAALPGWWSAHRDALLHPQVHAGISPLAHAPEPS